MTKRERQKQIETKLGLLKTLFETAENKQEDEAKRKWAVKGILEVSKVLSKMAKPE